MKRVKIVSSILNLLDGEIRVGSGSCNRQAINESEHGQIDFLFRSSHINYDNVSFISKCPVV